MKKLTTKDMVQAHADRVLKLKTPHEISDFIAEIGCKTQQRWGKAVAAIIEIGGPDYYALRGESRALSAESLRRQVTHEVTLFVDAKARCQRFGICDAAGKVLWHGIFFEDDNSFSYGDRDEQSACECAAARKAIWLASKIKEAAGATALRLNLNVDAQWLTTGGGKSTILQSDARRFNIELNLDWISGTSNPADAWTTASGYKRWDSENLEKYAMPVDPAQEKIDEANAEAEAKAAEIEAKAAEIEAKRIFNLPENVEARKAAAELAEAARIEREKSEAVEKIAATKLQLARVEECLANGRRAACQKKITTFHQFDQMVAAINRLRGELALPILTTDEISAAKAIQNFTAEYIGQLQTA